MGNPNSTGSSPAPAGTPVFATRVQPITVDPLIAERFSFICDIGSPLAELRAGWPDLAFDHLPDP
jgi:hypothetical protein